MIDQHCGDKDGWDYLGAGIAGFFGGLGGGLVAQAIFSVTGGLVDAAISDDLVENGFLSTMGSIAFGSGVFGNVTGGIGLTADVIRDRINKRKQMNNLPYMYSYGF